MLGALGRLQLAALGRYLSDNRSMAGYALDLIANYSTPVLAQAASPDPAWNKLADGEKGWCAVQDLNL